MYIPYIPQYKTTRCIFYFASVPIQNISLLCTLDVYFGFCIKCIVLELFVLNTYIPDCVKGNKIELIDNVCWFFLIPSLSICSPYNCIIVYLYIIKSDGALSICLIALRCLVYFKFNKINYVLKHIQHFFILNRLIK